jgi:hypothetical protein
VFLVTGAQLQDAIVEAARVLGWRAAHFRPARSTRGWRTPLAYDSAGWPDLVLVRDRVIFAEVKGDRDRLRPEQTAWLLALDNAGAETYVWKAADWADGSIDRVLR